MRHEWVPEEEDVAGHGLDGEVLVDGADHGLFGLDHDPVIADFGDGARRWSRRPGEHPGAPAGRELTWSRWR